MAKIVDGYIFEETYVVDQKFFSQIKITCYAYFTLSRMGDIVSADTVWHKILTGENFDEWASGKYIKS